MKRAALLVGLACCAHHHSEESGYPYEEHTCDPKGADVARYEMPVELESQLFPDERSLRSRCVAPHERRGWRVPEIARDLQGEAMQSLRHCAGPCNAMYESLPTLDDAHDLEDETLQRECTMAVTKVETKLQAQCRHVCLVDRRELASEAIFARTMLGLFSFARNLPPQSADAHKTWLDAKLPPLPKRFRLTIEKQTMSAEGTMYPGGPPLRLRLTEGDAGCGASEWTVDRW